MKDFKDFNIINQNDDNNKQVGPNPMFFSLLPVLFIGLKLAEVGVVAGWSWWWVLAPLWMPISLIVALGLILALIIAISEAVRN